MPAPVQAPTASAPETPQRIKVDPAVLAVVARPSAPEITPPAAAAPPVVKAPVATPVAEKSPRAKKAPEDAIDFKGKLREFQLLALEQIRSGVSTDVAIEFLQRTI